MENENTILSGYNTQSPILSGYDTPFYEQIEEIIPEKNTVTLKNINIQKCVDCNKDGWIKSDSFEDGLEKTRLCRVIRDNSFKIKCLNCIEKEKTQ
jgi:hypothetical protein